MKHREFQDDGTLIEWDDETGLEVEIEHLGDGCWVERQGESVIFRWRDYKAIVDSRRMTLWRLLAYPVMVCPYCFHIWTPRVPEPLSCPACHSYLTRKREPRPEGYELVTPEMWHDGWV
jgi:hypothetical protein